MPTSGRARLLVADDQPDVLEALRLLLSQHDFSLLLVTSPVTVLERLREDDFDLLLIEYVALDLDRVVVAIRSLHPVRRFVDVVRAVEEE